MVVRSTRPRCLVCVVLLAKPQAPLSWGSWAGGGGLRSEGRLSESSQCRIDEVHRITAARGTKAGVSLKRDSMSL